MTEPLPSFQEFNPPEKAGPQPGIPAGVRVYAVGDVHGRLDLLRRMDMLILEDAGRHPGERAVVVFLGDYVDRGANSADVLESLIGDRPEGVETVCLRGNHEDYLLSVVEDDADPINWLRNGGDSTLESYGLDPWFFRHDFSSVGAALKTVIPTAHLEFLHGLPLSHRIGRAYFAHAGINPDRPLEAQRPWDLLWMREPFLSSTRDHGAVVVHGHTPVLEPEILANRINCDTGAYATGRLSAAVLAGGAVRFLQT